MVRESYGLWNNDDNGGRGIYDFHSFFLLRLNMWLNVRVV